jgi:hypothetical protein
MVNAIELLKAAAYPDPHYEPNQDEIRFVETQPLEVTLLHLRTNRARHPVSRRMLANVVLKATSIAAATSLESQHPTQPLTQQQRVQEARARIMHRFRH